MDKTVIAAAAIYIIYMKVYSKKFKIFILASLAIYTSQGIYSFHLGRVPKA